MAQHASLPHQPDPDCYHHLRGQPCQSLLLLLFIPPQPNWPLWCCDQLPHMYLCHGSSPCWSVLPRVSSECHLLNEAFTDSTNQIAIFSPSPNTVTIIFYFSLSTQRNLKPLPVFPSRVSAAWRQAHFCLFSTASSRAQEALCLNNKHIFIERMDECVCTQVKFLPLSSCVTSNIHFTFLGLPPSIGKVVLIIWSFSHRRNSVIFL